MNEPKRVLKPTKGLIVIDPATYKPLSPDGATVRGNAEYWIRRLNDGDVEEIDVQVEQATEQAAVAQE